jgi:hypothetical protein
LGSAVAVRFLRRVTALATVEMGKGEEAADVALEEVWEEEAV